MKLGQTLWVQLPNLLRYSVIIELYLNSILNVEYIAKFSLMFPRGEDYSFPDGLDIRPEPQIAKKKLYLEISKQSRKHHGSADIEEVRAIGCATLNSKFGFLLA